MRTRGFVQRDLVRLHMAAAEGWIEGPEWLEDPLMELRRARWGMLYADYGGTVSLSIHGVARMMTVLVEDFE